MTQTIQLTRKARGPETILSNRAAIEARNELATTLLVLETSADGLIAAEAQRRLEVNGPNETAHERPPHWSLQLLSTFRNPFILVLATLAGISLALDPTDLKGPIIISTMILLSVVVRFWQEYRSSRAADGDCDLVFNL